MKNTIQKFIDKKKVAIAGVSRDPEKFGNNILHHLKKTGYEVYALNPHADIIENEKSYHHVSELPADVDHVIIATKPEYTLQLVKDCQASGIKRVWMLRGAGKGSATPEAIEFCKENGLEYVYGVCPMMFFDKGMHHFHFWLRKTFGKMPVELLN